MKEGFLITKVKDPYDRNHYYTQNSLVWCNKMLKLRSNGIRISAGIIQKTYGKLGRQTIYYVTEL